MLTAVSSRAVDARWAEHLSICNLKQRNWCNPPDLSTFSTAASLPRPMSSDSLGGDCEAATQRTADSAGMTVHDPPADGSGAGGTSGAGRPDSDAHPPNGYSE